MKSLAVLLIALLSQCLCHASQAPSDHTLVVIDVQDDFTCEDVPFFLSSVADEIDHAIEHNRPIIFIDYADHGKINKQLRNLVRRYPHAVFLQKKTISAGNVLLKYWQENAFPKDVSVCGLYLTECVYLTMTALVRIQKKHPMRLTLLADTTLAITYSTHTQLNADGIIAGLKNSGCIAQNVIVILS